MLTADGLKRIAGKEGVPQAVVERDYALSIALNAIADATIERYLVFKGGTAIKKAYFEDARFSEDLDFNAKGINKSEILDGLNGALAGKTIGGVTFERAEEEKSRAGLKAAIKFTGPLQYPQRIRCDFNFRQNLADRPPQKGLIDTYGIGTREISALSIEELFAEKIHALGSRAAPRDLYDVDFLLDKGVRPDLRLITLKFAYYDEKIDVDKIAKNIGLIETEWKRDLERLLSTVPDYEKTATRVKTAIKTAVEL